jgi:hypothetical protein
VKDYTVVASIMATVTITIGAEDEAQLCDRFFCKG